MMMDDIKDVLPPVNPPLEASDFLWLYLLVGFAICIAIYFFLKNRVKHPELVIDVPLRSSWDIALEKLEVLYQKHYPEQGMYKSFYVELSNIVRHYLEDRFAIKAPEMTTEEFLSFVHNSPKLKDQYKKSLKGFLDGSDLVKFAKHVPTIDEAMANFKLAKGLVEETKQ